MTMAQIEDVYNLPGIRNDEMMKEPLCDAVAMHVSPVEN